MLVKNKIKKTFLIATIILFSYRAILSSFNDPECKKFPESSKTNLLSKFQENCNLIEKRDAYLTLLSESMPTPQQTKNAKELEALTTKLNNQIKHYAYMVALEVDKEQQDQKILNSIEREIDRLEKRATVNGIYQLIDRDLIKKIRETIQWLRTAATQREKVNKI